MDSHLLRCQFSVTFLSRMGGKTKDRATTLSNTYWARIYFRCFGYIYGYYFSFFVFCFLFTQTGWWWFANNWIYMELEVVWLFPPRKMKNSPRDERRTTKVFFADLWESTTVIRKRIAEEYRGVEVVSMVMGTNTHILWRSRGERLLAHLTVTMGTAREWGRGANRVFVCFSCSSLGIINKGYLAYRDLSGFGQIECRRLDMIVLLAEWVNILNRNYFSRMLLFSCNNN